MATERTQLLLGCYRKGDANDPEIYARAVTAVLMRYPQHVVIEVTEPATGMPAKFKWLPAIAEIVESCEKAMAPIYRRLEREQERRRTALALTDQRPSQIIQGERDRVSFGLSAIKERLKSAMDPIGDMIRSHREKERRETTERQREREQVEAWNREVEIGGAISFTDDDGKIIDSTTRTHAVVIRGKGPVLWLDGVAGSVPLASVKLRPPTE